MLHIRFRCKWCGHLTSGCPDWCNQPHRVDEVESCAFCAQRPVEELRVAETAPDDPEVTHHMLASVLENPPTIETVIAWTRGQRRAAEDWAYREFNNTTYAGTAVRMIDRVRRPAFIREEVTC